MWLNLFLPSVKLLKKVRVGSKVRRVYDGPRTPFERVRDCPQADREKVAQLETLRKRLDPFQLARTIERKLERIYGLANRRLCRKPLPAQERGGKKAVEKTLAPRAWKSQTDFHFPPATATAVNLPFRLHLKCLDDQSYGYIPKWLDRTGLAPKQSVLPNVQFIMARVYRWARRQDETRLFVPIRIGAWLVFSVSYEQF